MNLNSSRRLEWKESAYDQLRSKSGIILDRIIICLCLRLNIHGRQDNYHN